MNYVLLWSRRQNALHIEPLEQMLSRNRIAYRDDKVTDYVTLHIGTREEVSDAATACRHTLDGRVSESRRVVVKDRADAPKDCPDCMPVLCNAKCGEAA